MDHIWISVIAGARSGTRVNAFRRYRFMQETNRIIEEEKNRSDVLLRNILPEETALELKEQGYVKARKIEGVTVLFTDFIEFTRYAEQVAPEQMVRSIDYYFKKFDEITTRYNLEKIKLLVTPICVPGDSIPNHAEQKRL